MAETTAANDAEKSDAPKNKLVRDSFTIPKAEYAVLNELKQRATRLTRPAGRHRAAQGPVGYGLPRRAGRRAQPQDRPPPEGR